MPFDRSDAKLDALIVRAREEDSDVAAELAQMGERSAAEILDEVKAEESRFWEAAISEIAAHDQGETEIQSLLERVDQQAGPPPRAPSAKLDFGTNSLPIAGCLTGVVAVGFVVYLLFTVGWRDVFGTLLTLHGWAWVGGALALIALPLVFDAIVSAYRRRRWEAHKGHGEALQQYWEDLRKEFAREGGLEAAQANQFLLVQRVERALLDLAIKPALRSAINRRTKASYGTRLDVRKPRGFGEVFDPRFAIDTDARQRLRYHLENMPGGSIGIAGSRGAGKTTLLKLCCGPKRVVEKLNDKPVLGVLVSAPVAYEARDFLLYLFSTLCQTVIQAGGGQLRGPTAPPEEESPNPLDAPMLQVLRPLPTRLVGVGLCLVVLGLALSLAIASLENSTPPFDPAVNRVQRPKAVDAPGGQRAPARPGPNSRPQSSVPADSDPISDGVLREPRRAFAFAWLAALEINGADLFRWGLALTGGGLALGLVLGRRPRRLLNVAMARLLHFTLGLFPLYSAVTRRLLERLLAEDESPELNVAPRDAFRLRGEDHADPSIDVAVQLRSRAEEWLKAIKFQQSYTSGWSGSLKLPVGVEGGFSRALTLAEKQLSLPEIVHHLATFIDVVSQHYQVIIGIDELDKLESDAKAQCFLNDIKSIFGLESCFYLISVSENAMSSFERRGLPFRDVFDSSFDLIIYVDYLNFAAAQELLQQRMLGRPIPFFGLSYCMSGGLARDLIRHFRHVLKFRQSHPTENDLSSICRAIVDSDLRAKVRATTISVKKIDLEPEVDSYLKKLYLLEDKFNSPADLLDAAAELLDEARSMTPTPAAESAPRGSPDSTHPASDSRVAQREALADLGAELATYIQYSATLRQFFNDTLSKAMLTSPPPGGSLDALAKARQVMQVNPNITRTLVEAFRRAHGLPDMPLPHVVFPIRTESNRSRPPRTPPAPP